MESQEPVPEGAWFIFLVPFMLCFFVRIFAQFPAEMDFDTKVYFSSFMISHWRLDLVLIQQQPNYKNSTAVNELTSMQSSAELSQNWVLRTSHGSRWSPWEKMLVGFDMF